ncbi:uncharacterized protein DSM5745_01009 [Aspergillus mulundensis]|uniref:Uncharacterized protein n=1 Tax=Aspergillus mulundensis TaxID=1810919 RepID=A0A3D8T545_9EURO|nr:hypothetical protein DSM5745_01009 [Aspergillus mulundensis]RDW93687.1 hypothetical protein DSM5745_01009 [Aspergillus mulundensis]
MKYVRFFLLSLVWLWGAALGLKESQPAETLYFYEAYLVEFQTKEPEDRIIAKRCTDEPKPCSFTKFVEHIVGEESFFALTDDQMRIIAEADGTDVTTTSRRLRETGFKVDYDLPALIEGIVPEDETPGGKTPGDETPGDETGNKKPGDKKPGDQKPKPKFSNVFKKINEAIGPHLNTGDFAAEKRRMADALKLIVEHRVADNMKFFLRNLKSKLSGVKLVITSRTTSDGFVYKAYDTKETAQKMRDEANKLNDGMQKTTALRRANGLSEEIKKAIEALRDANFETKDGGFKGHQAVITEAKKTQKLLQKPGQC